MPWRQNQISGCWGGELGETLPHRCAVCTGLAESPEQGRGAGRTALNGLNATELALKWVILCYVNSSRC